MKEYLPLTIILASPKYFFSPTRPLWYEIETELGKQNKTHFPVTINRSGWRKQNTRIMSKLLCTKTTALGGHSIYAVMLAPFE